MDLSQHFSTGKLLRFAAPSIAVAIFTSLYGIVDGLFISNFAGKTAFAAVNFIMPVIMILSTVGFMVGTGGSAIVAHTMGQGKTEKANGQFTLLVIFCAVVGAILAVAGFFLFPTIGSAMGATGEMLDECVLYARISMISLPGFMLQYAFQTFFATAGKPKYSLRISIVAGVANMVLDAVFVGALGFGVAGAAAATVVSELIGGFVPVIYFARQNNSSLLRLSKPKLDWGVIGRTCVNGSSEMVACIALSVASIAYNFQLLAYLGENGVAAYGVIMYVSFIFTGAFEGFCSGTAPLMSFQYGAENAIEMRSLFHKSLGILAAAGVLMLALAEATAWPFACIFASYDSELFELTVYGTRIYSIAYLIMGFGMYASSLFTALGNGPISAFLSFVRTLVFETGCVIVLPLLFGADAIWFSVVVAEVASCVVATILVMKLGPRYQLM